MAINYSNSGFVDPNTQIKSTQIPLSGIEKGVDKLTKYYDAARDNETKTESYIRKLKSSVHPIDQELADKLGADFNQRIKDRVAKGNYEDMVWQTQGDAQDVAVMYDKLSKDSELIRKQEEAIRTDKAILSQEDRDTEAAMYLENLKKNRPQYLPQGRALTPGLITSPSYTPDVHGVDFIGKIANGWQFDSNSQGKLTTHRATGKEQRADGSFYNPGEMFVTNSQGKIAYIDEQEMNQALHSSIQNDPAVGSSLQQSLNRSLFRQPLREGETEEMRKTELYNKLFGSQVDFVAQRDSYTREEDKYAETQNKGKTGSTGGVGSEGTEPSSIERNRVPGETEITKGKIGAVGEALNIVGGKGPLTMGADVNAPTGGLYKTSYDLPASKAVVRNYLVDILQSNNPGFDVLRNIRVNTSSPSSVYNKLESGEPLSYDDKSVLEEIQLKRESMVGSTKNLRNAAHSYEAPGSINMTQTLQSMYPQFVTGKDKIYNDKEALDFAEKQLFGESGNIMDGTGHIQDMELLDPKTNKVIRGNRLIKALNDEEFDNIDIPDDIEDIESPAVNKGDKGVKESKASILGAVNPTNMGGFYLDRKNDDGTYTEGNQKFANGLVVAIGGKQFIVANPALKGNINPKSPKGIKMNSNIATGITQLLRDEDAPADFRIENSNQEKIEISMKKISPTIREFTLYPGTKKEEKIKVYDNANKLLKVPTFDERGNKTFKIITSNTPTGTFTEAALKRLYPNMEEKGYEIVDVDPVEALINHALTN